MCFILIMFHYDININIYAWLIILLKIYLKKMSIKNISRGQK